MSRSVGSADRGERRWLVVAALFVVTSGMATPLASYGVFLAFLAETFGWSRGAISAARSITRGLALAFGAAPCAALLSRTFFALATSRRVRRVTVP